jgi:hypothetical protein
MFGLIDTMASVSRDSTYATVLSKHRESDLDCRSFLGRRLGPSIELLIPNEMYYGH